MRFLLRLPVAWNVGPLVPVSGAEPDLPVPHTAEGTIYPPDSDVVRRETGRREAAVFIRYEGKLVAVLWPETLRMIEAHLAVMGVR